MKVKGEFNGLCNRTACQSDLKVVYYNKGTYKYYCKSCAIRINHECHEEICVLREE